MDKSNKNSLLGQLEAKGLFGKDSPNGEIFPFGMLTGFGGENSPFVENADSTAQDDAACQRIMKKRLNDLDNNIFQESSFLDIDDSELDNQEKIKKINLLIKNVDKKIFMLEDSDDEILLSKLKNEKEVLTGALRLLTDENSKIEHIKSAAGKMRLKEKIRKAENIIFKLCPVLRKNFLARKALNKLVMLNESAKNLCNKQIPYGEQEGRYSDFIAYLNCANIIHSKLTKKM